MLIKYYVHNFMVLFRYIGSRLATQKLRHYRLVNLILIAYPLLLVIHGNTLAESVHIPDPYLRDALELALGKAENEDITPTDMSSLQVLQASKCRFLMLSEVESFGTPNRWVCQDSADFQTGINNLTGIEFAVNLKELHLGRNFITDISPLKNLTKLEYLDLGLNRTISDISPLRDLISLTHLSLRFNQVSDLSPLKNLTNLIDLDLFENQISDVSLLMHLADSLMFLELGYNDLTTDISSLSNLTKLTFLSLRYNQISDLSPLEGLTNLIGLDIQHNQLSDLSPLRDLRKLQILDVDSNQISDVTPLKDLTELLLLDISDNEISDISSIKGLINLGWLDIDDNHLQDITALKDLTELIELDLDDNEIEDISLIENMRYLKWLDLDDNQISDVSPLQNLTELTYLDLDGNQISDVTPLKNLIELRFLDLDNNQVLDVSPLRNLIHLDELDLHNNHISDVSPLNNLVNLIDLDLDDNQISDISALYTLTKLRVLDLNGNQILDLTPLQGLTNLIELVLHDNHISNVLPLRGLINLSILDLSENRISVFYPIAGIIENLVEYDTSNQSVPTYKTEDVNRDGTVNTTDLLLIASYFHNSDLETLAESNIFPDVNFDSTVNLIDLLIVAAEMSVDTAAPVLSKDSVEVSDITAKELSHWIQRAKQLDTNDPQLQKGIAFLEQLLEVFSIGNVLPKETALLTNYPNPFNPETWIPFQLSEPAQVNISIHAVDGKRIRTLKLGYLPIGIYYNKDRSSYWDGKNEFGESVSSGVYYYTLLAGEFTDIGRMLIVK